MRFRNIVFVLFLLQVSIINSYARDNYYSYNNFCENYIYQFNFKKNKHTVYQKYIIDGKSSYRSNAIILKRKSKTIYEMDSEYFPRLHVDKDNTPIKIEASKQSIKFINLHPCDQKQALSLVNAVKSKNAKKKNNKKIIPRIEELKDLYNQKYYSEVSCNKRMYYIDKQGLGGFAIMSGDRKGRRVVHYNDFTIKKVNEEIFLLGNGPYPKIYFKGLVPIKMEAKENSFNLLKDCSKEDARNMIDGFKKYKK
ncbi:hypothetical protein A9Q84_14095 [Halobacteriovorax marinus]|uniref:Uncharacterized protein n=1 Tax=Halobacteriovorax marinus TaxID=97084 RepID=A0A1Y5F4Q1_9BACT|nr:hypothetical protein A9Q84_14095 [Halobacteriovorax marinus]